MEVDEGERLAPEAFETLGHEVRLQIVQELAEPRRLNWRWEGMSFSDLRKAVGVRDAGNFSYHLDELRDTFVVKDGEEYYLTNAGMRFVGDVVAGGYGADTDAREGTVDRTCPGCERSLRVRYESEYFRVACPEHGYMYGADLQPGVVEGRSLSSLLDVAMRDTRNDVEQARNGVCPHCRGPMNATLPAPEVTFPQADREIPDDAVMVEFACDRCEMTFFTPPGVCVVSHPDVVAYLHERGVDYRDAPFVELPFVQVGIATVESTDPTRVHLPVTTESLWEVTDGEPTRVVPEEALEVVLDGEAGVVDVEWP